MNAPIPLEELLSVSAGKRSITIGLPAASSPVERRFPLTPEGAGMLVERGFGVKMEKGASTYIHYSDEAYARCGVEIVERAEAFGADIVLYLPPLEVADARMLRRGALLLSFMHARDADGDTIRTLVERHVIALALELICDDNGHCPFADILHEIDGRAAIAIASSLLADSVHGKGILLGGVAGVVPCEVLITGSDMAAIAAAKGAIGMGAIVRMFDDNVYRMREASSVLGSGAIFSSLHPRVFAGALHSADIIVATDTTLHRAVVDASMAATMKRGVICFDLTSAPGSAFPSLPVVDLDMASPWDNNVTEPTRLCYINAGNAVPRTVAMALSNTFATMLDDIIVCDGVANALKLKEGLRRAAYTFLGKCVNPQAARAAGLRSVDINLFLQFS